MKKNLKKKALLPAIAMVLASVIALSGVTYAWFTTGNTATVGELQVNVQTANGIQVSLDAASWRSVITADDIKDAVSNANAYSGRTIQFPEGEIAPVSSAGIVADGKLQMFYGEYNKDGTLLSVAEVEQNRTTGGNFVAFDLFFKSSSDQVMTLKMGDEQSYVKGTDALGGSATAGTETAVRVAFLPMGSAADAATARGLKGDGDIWIWEPNSTTRAPGGVETSGKLDYSGFKAEFSAVKEDALSSAEVAPVSTYDPAEYDLVELKAGINKVRVYIWLEGQDVDCINNISFGDFAANLYFSVPEVTD